MSRVKKTNYIVTTQEWKDRFFADRKVRIFDENQFQCETDYEVRTLIGKGKFDRMYQVTSPVGLPVSQFAPF